MFRGSLYFLPGRGEKLIDHPGNAISQLGFAIHGRETVADFARLRFRDQLSLIRSDLQPAFWQPDAKIVARSFGAYLLLNVLAELDPFPGRILLFSPVLGTAVLNGGRYASVPPRAARFFQLVEAGQFPPPNYLEIHTGALDKGCDPSVAARFASLVRRRAIEA